MLHVSRCASGVPGRLSEIGFSVTHASQTELADISDSFDAIVFTQVLSSVESLETVVGHASRLLAPSGRLVVDDFDIAAPDAPTLRWLYETQELLVVAGIHAPDRVHAPIADARARWLHGVRANGTLHNGTDMRVAVSAHFMIRELRRLEFLYRCVADGLPADARGAAITAHLRGVERRMLANDMLMPVGLRIVADRAR